MNKLKMHITAHMERRCRCGATVSSEVHDYGVLTYRELDDRLGDENYPVIPLKCPKCGTTEWPQNIVIYDLTNGGLEPVIKSKIGTDGIPVIGENLPYAVTVPEEEQAEYDRGLAKKDDVYHECKDAFWGDYGSFALKKWTLLLREITEKEFRQAYKLLGIPILPESASVVAFRRDAEKRFTGDNQKMALWQAVNTYLVEKEFVWTPIDTWPMNEWAKMYGRERVTYCTLHVPLPEELERWRTKALSKVVRKRSGETGILFDRIGQIGKELEKQRNRSTELSRLLAEERQETAALADRIGQLKKKMAEINNNPSAVVHRDPKDVTKIKALKGLVAELRQEVDRLHVMIYQETTIEEKPEILIPETSFEEIKEVDLSILRGKTVLIVGWPNEDTKDPCRVIWHGGESVDLKLQAMVKEADILVVLTRFISHQAMWWLKEAAIDTDKPIHFLRERNIGRILDIVSEKEKVRVE